MDCRFPLKGLVAPETLLDQAVCHLDKHTIHHRGRLVCGQLGVGWRDSPLLTDTCITQRASTFAHQQLSSVVAYNDAGLSSYGEESSEYLDELHGWAVYSKFQVNCSGIQAGEYHSIILGCLVTTNFNMVRAKEIGGRVIKRRCTRGQTAFRQFSHDWRFPLACISR